MRVLVTGATGFVGGWMVERLLAQPGWQPFALGRSGRWPDGLSHLAAVPLAVIDWDRPETVCRQIPMPSFTWLAMPALANHFANLKRRGGGTSPSPAIYSKPLMSADKNPVCSMWEPD